MLTRRFCVPGKVTQLTLLVQHVGGRCCGTHSKEGTSHKVDYLGSFAAGNVLELNNCCAMVIAVDGIRGAITVVAMSCCLNAVRRFAAKQLCFFGELYSL